MRKASVIGASAAALLLAGSAWGQDDTVRIGIVSATSGPLAAPGKFQLNGFNLAVDQINAAGGVEVGGETYQLELIVYDTHCNAAEGASAMQRLATLDQVPVVLGELCSPVAAAEAVIAQDYQVPLILTVTTADSLTEQGNPYVFRVNANAAQLNEQLAAFVAAQSWSPLAYLAWNNDTGQSGVRGMKALLEGAIESGYEGYFNVGEVDFSSHISNIRNEGAAAVMLFMDEEPGSLAIDQIRDAGLDVQLVGTLAMGSDRFLERLDAEKLAGMVQYANFPPNADVPRIREFNTMYREAYGEESHGFAAQSYDGLMVAVEAMVQAGTVSDSQAIRDALATIEYEGVTGLIRFNEKGQNEPPVYITQWCADGTRSIVAPADAVAPCGKG